MKPKRGQFGGSLVNNAIGIGLFVFVLAVFAVFLGEGQKASEYYTCSGGFGMNASHCCQDGYPLNSSGLCYNCTANTTDGSLCDPVGNGTTILGSTGALSTVNNTYSEGMDTLSTGAKFGPVLVVLVILLLAMAAFTRLR